MSVCLSMCAQCQLGSTLATLNRMSGLDHGMFSLVLNHLKIRIVLIVFISTFVCRDLSWSRLLCFYSLTNQKLSLCIYLFSMLDKVIMKQVQTTQTSKEIIQSKTNAGDTFKGDQSSLRKITFRWMV